MISCQEREECVKFANEKYVEQEKDTTIVRNSFELRTFILEELEEVSIKGLNYEAYHLLFHSAHGYGKSVKFEKKEDGIFLNVKCLFKGDWPLDCNETQKIIKIEEWNELEDLIYEFNFWTDINFKEGRKGVLDGYVYLFEGNRPEAEQCDKESHKLVIRGSPKYDKMTALCEHILQLY